MYPFFIGVISCVYRIHTFLDIKIYIVAYLRLDCCVVALNCLACVKVCACKCVCSLHVCA